jgi:hypothetical protein
LFLEKDIMESAIRISISLTVVAGATFGALQIDREWIEKRAGEVWDLPSNFVKARRAAERGEEIVLERQLMNERLERKSQIARAVLEGGLSLGAAADLFQQASKNTPYDWDTYRLEHPAWPLKVRCAHLVIDDVGQILIAESKDPSAITATLRDQVAAWQDQ